MVTLGMMCHALTATTTPVSKTWMNVPLVPIPATSIPFARMQWAHTHARVMLGIQEMENHAMTSTSVLPALTAVTSMHCAAILWERTHARVKQVIQAMEEHALMPTSVLTTIIAVTSTRSVAILWHRTHAHVKQDTQEMGGIALMLMNVPAVYTAVTGSLHVRTPMGPTAVHVNSISVETVKTASLLNVRITQVLTAVTERLHTLLPTFIVTVESDLAGFALKGQPAQECQPHVHRIIDVALMQPDG